MKNAEQQNTPRIEEVLTSFSDGIEQLILKIQKQFDGRIIKGYESFKFKSKKRSILQFVEAANPLLQNYCKLLYDRKPDMIMVDEIMSLLLTPKQAEQQLKLKYLDCKEISIPNFRYKKERLAEVYDYPEDDQLLINSIIEKINFIQFAEAEEYKRYFNNEASAFEFTDADEANLLEQYTLYMSLDDISQMISLHLFCEGLSNIKTDEDYSFKSLPEIDHTIMRYIKIDTAKSRPIENGKLKIGGYETGISVDIDKFNNPDGSTPGIGVSQTPGGGAGPFKIVQQ